jgi:hypothetical protein
MKRTTFARFTDRPSQNEECNFFPSKLRIEPILPLNRIETLGVTNEVGSDGVGPAQYIRQWDARGGKQNDESHSWTHESIQFLR